MTGLRRARLPHQCDLCGQAIEPGEHYHRQTWAPGQWDGDHWVTQKACRWCRDRFSKYLEGGSEGTPSDWLTEELIYWLWTAGLDVERGRPGLLDPYWAPLWEAQEEASRRLRV